MGDIYTPFTRVARPLVRSSQDHLRHRAMLGELTNEKNIGGELRPVRDRDGRPRGS